MWKVPISLIHLVVCYLKLTIFKTSWFCLHIKPLQLYTVSIHSIFNWVHKLSSDNISFYLERERKCACAYELFLITLLMSRFYLILTRIQCLSLLLKLLIFILLHFPCCRVCSAVRWKQCTWTSQKQLWGITSLLIFYVMEKATLNSTGSNGGRGSVLICQIILSFTFPKLNRHKPRLLWYKANTGKINFQLVTRHSTGAENYFCDYFCWSPWFSWKCFVGPEWMLL